MKKAGVCLFIPLCLILYLPFQGLAQTTGTILGSVKDRTGAALPGVSVTITNTVTGERRNLITDDQGNYIAPLLPPSSYTIEFELAGFKKVVREGVKVRLLEQVVIDVVMDVGEIAEVITVVGEAPLLQTNSATLGRVVEELQIQQLPLATRNYTQILSLFAGTSVGVPDTAALGRGTQNISTTGARLVNNSFYFNGVDAMNVHTNSAVENPFASNGVAIPASDTIHEFKVQTSLYDAQFGRNAGANVNVVTKSGGSELHGNLYEFFRNDALNANNFFFNRTGTRKPVLRQNQFGFTLGGPIIRDRTFFFGSYQGTRQKNGASLATSTTSLSLPPIPRVRTRQELGRVFGGQRGLFGGVAVAADGSNINPVALALLNAKLPNGEPLIPSPQRLDSGVNFTTSIPARYQEDQFNINLDHLVYENNKLSFRFFFAETPQTRAFAGATLPGFPATQDFGNRNLAISNTHTFSPRLINEARFGLARYRGLMILDEPITVDQIGMRRFNSSIFPAIPLIVVSGVFSLGTTTNNDQGVTTNSFTYADTLSFVRGNHNMRLGFEFKRHQTNLFNNFASRGFLVFLSFPDFLLGLPAGPLEQGGNGTPFSNVFQSFIGSGITARHFRLSDFSFFFQDDWKLSNKLTLNLGLRYDIYGWITDRQGRLGNFDRRLHTPPPEGGSTSSGFVLAKNTKFPIPGIPLVNKTLLDELDANNFAPRFGLAYRPFGNKSLVVRAGYGIFYERMSNQVTLQLLTAPPFMILSNLSGGANAAASFQNPFITLPLPSEFPVKPAVFGPPFSATRPAITINNLDPKLRTPYLQHWSLNLQYEFAKDYLLEVGYVGSKGTSLAQIRQTNQALLASPDRPIRGITTNTAANAMLRVPVLGFTPSGLFEVETGANSSYNSLQLSVTKRFSQGLQFLASYTLSKSIDTSSGGTISLLGGVSGDQSDPRKQPRGPSDFFDRTHRFVLSYIYDLPAWGFGWNNTAFGRRFFRGWSIAGISTFQSGTPFSVEDTRGATLFGVTTARASFAPGASRKTATLSGPAKKRLERFFDTSAFVPAGPGFGNTGRGILRGPGQVNFDFSVIKKTSIEALGEQANLEFRAEFFNLFNHVNFANPVSNIASRNFGQILETSANARIIQFALKFNY